MDLQSTAIAMLRKYGAPENARNISMAMQELQSNPASEGSALGLQSGAGESGYDPSVFKSKLDKLAGDTERDSGGVSVGLPSGAPLPQAPLPENMPRPSNGASSPTPVATSPRATYPPPNEAVGSPNNITPTPMNTALDKVATDTARPSPAAVAPPTDIPQPPYSKGAPKLTYTIDPTAQIPDEFIIAGGSLAAGAALYAKAKADFQSIGKPNIPEVSGVDMAPPANGPRPAELGDIDTSAANTKRIQAELDADPSRKGLKQYSEPVDPEALKPKGPVEPQGKATKDFRSLRDAMKRARPRL